MSYLTITSVIKMHLRIRDLREDRDLKQFEIAEYLMCDQSLYSKYEREDRELPLRLAIMLATTSVVATATITFAFFGSSPPNLIASPDTNIWLLITW